MEPDQTSQEPVYSPAAILNIINNALNISQTKRLIQLKGLYQRGNDTNYSGYYYDSLKDETSDSQLRIIVPGLIRNQLQANKTITITSYITKKVYAIGSRIDIQLTVTDLVEQTHNKYSEEELKAISLLQRKASVGFKDVHSWLKEKIVHEVPFKIGIIIGKSAIIDNDIKHQLKESIAYYDITFFRINLTSEQEIMHALDTLQNDHDLLAISRGGGENLEIFNKPSIAEKSIALRVPFVTAIGHKDDDTLLQKVADKGFITPSAFGQFLHDTYNQTIEEAQDSKAKLVATITSQLKGQYQQEVVNLKNQLQSVETLKHKSVSDLQQVHQQQVANLQQQVINTQKTEQDKAAVLRQEIQSLQQQGNSKDQLVNNYKRQVTDLQSRSNFSWGAVIIGIIVGLIIGLAMRGH